ncbi:MAG: hypothetical protein WCS99_00485 [Limisphaerales bacterium]
MRTKLVLLVVLAVTLLFVTPILTQEPARNPKSKLTGVRPSVKVTKLMNAEDFKAAGLSKLSDEELKRLDTWLTTYTAEVMRLASSKGQPDSGEAIESQIEGEFKGWEGETVFQLTNNQIWQQSSYAYKYHYAYRPKVLIFKSGTGYKMKVDGVDGEISVKRLK